MRIANGEWRIELLVAARQLFNPYSLLAIRYSRETTPYSLFAGEPNG
jgi:hypothetical protein